MLEGGASIVLCSPISNVRNKDHTPIHLLPREQVPFWMPRSIQASPLTARPPCAGHDGTLITNGTSESWRPEVDQAQLAIHRWIGTAAGAQVVVASTRRTAETAARDYWTCPLVQTSERHPRLRRLSMGDVSVGAAARAWFWSFAVHVRVPRIGAWRAPQRLAIKDRTPPQGCTCDSPVRLASRHCRSDV